MSSRTLAALGATASTSQVSGPVAHLLNLHGTVAYALVGLLVFGEAAFLLGFFIPGETAVVIGGVLAGLGKVNLPTMMVVVVVCAIAGDSVGFEIGKKGGPWLLDRWPLRGRPGVRRSLEMIERYGGPAVFFGRFFAFARALIPGLAGMSGLRYRVFLPYNALGGLVWGIGYTLLGYIVGVSFERILSAIGKWSIVVAVAVLVAFIASRIVLSRRRARLGIDDGFEVVNLEGEPETDPGDGPGED